MDHRSNHGCHGEKNLTTSPRTRGSRPRRTRRGATESNPKHSGTGRGHGERNPSAGRARTGRQPKQRPPGENPHGTGMDRRAEEKGQPAGKPAGNGNGPKPDRHAINIARAIQEEVAPDTVILFGSRATGKHRENSDVDVMIITSSRDEKGREPGRAAHDHMTENPPYLHVDMVMVTREEFQRNRRAKQNVAGQADHHGVPMSREGLDYSEEYEDEYPVHWPETRLKLENMAEHHRAFNEMLEEGHWNQKLIGLTAQQAVENALRGLLSAHDDPTMFRHGLNRIWNHHVSEHHDPTDPSTRQLHEDVEALMEHTTYQDPASTTGYSNWLSEYATEYRCNRTPSPMTDQEKRRLQELVNNAVEQLSGRIHRISGTTEADVFPDGAPWE